MSRRHEMWPAGRGLWPPGWQRRRMYSYHSPRHCTYEPLLHGRCLAETQGPTSAEHFCYDSMRPAKTSSWSQGARRALMTFDDILDQIFMNMP